MRIFAVLFLFFLVSLSALWFLDSWAMSRSRRRVEDEARDRARLRAQGAFLELVEAMEGGRGQVPRGAFYSPGGCGCEVMVSGCDRHSPDAGEMIKAKGGSL